MKTQLQLEEHGFLQSTFLITYYAFFSLKCMEIISLRKALRRPAKHTVCFTLKHNASEVCNHKYPRWIITIAPCGEILLLYFFLMWWEDKISPKFPGAEV